MPGLFLVFLRFFKAIRDGLREPEFRQLSLFDAAEWREMDGQAKVQQPHSTQSNTL